MKGAVPLLVAVAVAVAGGQTTSPDVEMLVSKLGVYLTEYEKELSTLVALETQRQSEIRPPTGRASLQSGIGRVRRRTIESEVSFLRLPGDREWYGVRRVLRVDGKPVESVAPRLADVTKSSGAEQRALIEEIVRASSTHNLGSTRTINMPTVPLELLHPRNRQRFAFRMGGTSRIAATTTRELKFQELTTPSLVQDTSGRYLLADGSVWVEEASGRVWRVRVGFESSFRAVRGAETPTNELRVDFARDAALGLLVPHELRENMDTAGGGRVQSRATYSHFRRFTTSGRIIPES